MVIIFMLLQAMMVITWTNTYKISRTREERAIVTFLMGIVQMILIIAAISYMMGNSPGF